ncbi:HEAT repeat domain-containing protein [Paenibacillus sp. UKAQ_18]|uniref:HEAT repeat domain-containing protein n=1 Tax=Paenibacillus sp. MZ03-122A TaxID=2962033 RepID=UPI001F2BBAAC|nr:HEAT repeat domain-containing protein [Paenibacillus sp. MZ03-122A]MCF2718128.1 HEAT repeat domain-containing protein [Paenibacillus sp. UKAQ_18]MCP3776903.1 HEAT repeat domain-containing protein [Paenibacillus sp. MZ03-122A]
MNKMRLEEVIESGDLKEAVKIIEEIGEKLDYTFTPILLRYLATTDSVLLRNVIAITLADLVDREAVLPLIDLLRNPKTKGNRGTLLYALEFFDVSTHVVALVDLLDDTFEASRQSYQLISTVKDKITKAQKDICRQKIRRKLADYKNKYKRDFLLESLELFT